MSFFPSDAYSLAHALTPRYSDTETHPHLQKTQNLPDAQTAVMEVQAISTLASTEELEDRD